MRHDLENILGVPPFVQHCHRYDPLDFAGWTVHQFEPGHIRLVFGSRRDRQHLFGGLVSRNLFPIFEEVGQFLGHLVTSPDIFGNDDCQWADTALLQLSLPLVMSLVDQLPFLLGALNLDRHLRHVVHALDEALLNRLPQRVPGNHIRKIVVADVASAGNANNIPETVLRIQQELLPLLGVALRLVRDVMRLVVEHGHAASFALQAVANGRFYVLQNGMVVFHTNRTLHDAFRGIDDLRRADLRPLGQQIPQVGVTGQSPELLHETGLNRVGRRQHQHAINCALCQ